ncbi:hypothetical protein CFE70_002973 [Pyrenophora teres f. teres 0-1]
MVLAGGTLGAFDGRTKIQAARRNNAQAVTGAVAERRTMPSEGEQAGGGGGGDDGGEGTTQSCTTYTLHIAHCTLETAICFWMDCQYSPIPDHGRLAGHLGDRSQSG